MSKHNGYAILVVWTNGEEEYLKQGLSASRVAKFPNRHAANEQKEFMRMGMDDDEVESISVVQYPSQQGRAR